MSDFAQRLKELRKQRNLRQTDLAQALGVAQTTIANYEKKLRFPDEKMLGRFVDFFDVSFDFLLGRSDTRGRAGGPSAADGIQPRAARSLPEPAARYLDLLRSQGAEAAAELAREASRGESGIRGVYVDIMAPALRETGRLWELGQLRVGEEHLISEATRRIMAAILPAAGSPLGTQGPSCIVLAVSREQHTIGSAMVADLLRLDGWEVRYPGGNLSTGHVLELLGSEPPDLVALSVTMAANLTDAADLIAAIRDRSGLRRVRIAVGGQAFEPEPRLWRDIGADGTAEDAATAVEKCNSLVGRRPGPPGSGEPAAE